MFIVTLLCCSSSSDVVLVCNAVLCHILVRIAGDVDKFEILPSEGQNFDLAKYIVLSTRYEYSIQYIVSYDIIHCF